MITLSLRYKNKIIESVCYIAESDATPLQASLDLGLIKLTYSVESSKLASSPVLDKKVKYAYGIRNCHIQKTQIEEERAWFIGQVMNKYGDLFQGIGVFPCVSKLHLKPNAVPVINDPWHVPQAL
jgi:hypothetical protein